MGYFRDVLVKKTYTQCPHCGSTCVQWAKSSRKGKRAQKELQCRMCGRKF